jgi:hypothetical protein
MDDDSDDNDNDDASEIAQRYYVELASAFVTGRMPELASLEPIERIVRGKRAGLRLHKFKRNTELPRVRKILRRPIRRSSAERLAVVVMSTGTATRISSWVRTTLTRWTVGRMCISGIPVARVRCRSAGFFSVIRGSLPSCSA